MGQNTPSHYNATDLEKYRTSSPKYDWNKSKTIRMHPLKKTPASKAEVSPASYKPDQSAKSFYKAVPMNTFTKEKGKSFMMKLEKDKKLVPGPG